MTSRRVREYLFSAHAADLRRCDPAAGEQFICPICMRPFSHNDLEVGKLTVGRVWAADLRANSNLAASQKVLLCFDCNSTSGSRGEKQLQLREKLKKGVASGRPYGERRVDILLPHGETPIHLNASVVMPPAADQHHARLSFALDAKGARWARNDPGERKRFSRLVGSDNRCTVIIGPHREHRGKHEWARAGWMTSAYLLAFYTFGYRYIVDSDLDPLRAYILGSFEDGVQGTLKFPASPTLCLQECAEHYCIDPEIALVIPLDGKSAVYLQVTFMDYYVRLPFRFVPDVLWRLVCGEPEVAEALLQMAQEEGATVNIPVACAKADGHECVWDFVLGKPLPRPENCLQTRVDSECAVINGAVRSAAPSHR